MENQPDDLAAKVLREFDLMAARRGTFERQWEEVAQKVLPYYSTTFYSQGNQTPGVRRGYEQYDTTASSALWKFGAAMESMLTPGSSMWSRIRPVDKNLLKDADARLWFDHVNDTLFHYRYSANSGFQSNQHDQYISIGAFGTGAKFTDAFRDPTQPKVKGLRYRHIHLGELFFATNHQGQVDKVARRFKMTLRQIAQAFGMEKMPEAMQGKLKTNPDEEVFIVHLVKPNTDYDPGRLDAKGKRFASYYVLKDTKSLLGTGGYRCMPYDVARYLSAPGELYGRSPAMNVLANINVINEQSKTVLKQGQRVVDPVLLAHDDGILDGFSLKPGAINAGAVSAEGRPLVHTLPTGNLAVTKELMDDQRYAINDAFLVTLFQILVETPQMTATEVLERAREKGALLSPTMGRFQSEALGSMIHREFDVLMDQGLVMPPPPAVVEAGAQYQVEYDAPLNRSMRADVAAGTMRSIQWAAEIAGQTQDPSPLDVFNFDAIIPELADINGAPARFIRSPDEVAAIREQRNQAQAAAQVTQALPGIAALTKAANPQGTSPAPGQPG